METLLQTPVVEAGRISLVATAAFMGWRVNSQVYFEYLGDVSAWVIRQRNVPQFVKANSATYSAVNSFIDAKHRLSIPRVVLETLGIARQKNQVFLLAMRPPNKKKSNSAEPAIFLFSATVAAQIIINAIDESH